MEELGVYQCSALSHCERNGTARDLADGYPRRRKRPAKLENDPRGVNCLALALHFERLQQLEGESGFCRQSDVAVPSETGTAGARGRTD